MVRGPVIGKVSSEIVFLMCFYLCVPFISKDSRVLFIILGQVLHRRNHKRDRSPAASVVTGAWTVRFASVPAMTPMLPFEGLSAHGSFGVRPLSDICGFPLNPLPICRTVPPPTVSQVPTSVDPVNAILSIPT